MAPPAMAAIGPNMDVPRKKAVTVVTMPAAPSQGGSYAGQDDGNTGSPGCERNNLLDQFELGFLSGANTASAK